MSTEYTPVEGDLVRVVMEGEVTFVSGHAFNMAGLSCVTPERAVSIEKIEPPVPAWQAGDVVTFCGQARILGDDGRWRNAAGKVTVGTPGGYAINDFDVIAIVRGGKLVDHRAEAG